MARPERPVAGDGPLAMLARELKRVRQRAGNPGYRELSEKTHYSRETLSAAARGKECPTWKVTQAFAHACDPTGQVTARVRPLWDQASKASRRRRRQSVHRNGVSGSYGGRPDARNGPPRADPDGGPAQFVYQLNALRVWAGKPGHKEIARRAGRPLASSTMYEALSKTRTTLPPLETVQIIVYGCLTDKLAEIDASNWIIAWRTIALREFQHANPAPSVGEQATRPTLRIVSSK